MTKWSWWLRPWTCWTHMQTTRLWVESPHTLSFQSFSVRTSSFPEQDLYLKCAPVDSAINENLAIEYWQ